MTEFLRSSTKAGAFLLITLLTVVIFQTPVSAQVLYGTLTGSVTDASGSVVPGAEITATNTQTGIQTKTESNATGLYALNNLQAGIYRVSAVAQGFRTVTHEGVTVVINTVTRSNFELQIGQVAEQVTVEASAVTLQTEKTDVSANISAKEVSSLPLPAFRNYQSLLDLVPGTTPAAFQNSVIDSPARAMTTNVNGTARNMNTTRVDGAVNVFVWLPHHVAYVPPVETVETVNVSTNNFDAEQGLAGGAAVTLATKSGTNELHGTLFEYHDNQHLFARNFFLAGTQDKPVTINNIYGGTVGGPIIKNKWFFFGGIEANRQRLGANRSSDIVATQAMRNGDFSGWSSLVYDPSSGAADGQGRTAFANNAIPSSRISSIAQAAQSLVPLPNVSGTSANYLSSGSRKFDRYNYDVKSDYNINENWRVWGKYGRMDADVTAKGAFGAAVGPGIGGDPGTGDTLVELITVGTSKTFSSAVLLDGNFGWTHMDQAVTAEDYGTNIGASLGIPGINDQRGSDVRYSGMPAFAISGLTTFGNSQTWMPMWRDDSSYAGNLNVGWMKGNHNIRFGMDMVKHQLNHWQPETANPRGNFDFAQGLTALRLNAAGASSPTTVANSYAAFLLGLTSGMSKSLQYEEMSGREWQLGYYIRDRWQATPRLTLTLGLRYEFYPLIHRANSGIEYYNVADNTMERGGIGGVPDNAGIRVSKKLFAPRVGFAYKLFDKTVIRSGYGITYNAIPLSRPLRGFYPFTVSLEVSQPNSFVTAGTLASGIPLFDGPDRSQGVIDVPLRVTTRSVWAPDGERNLRRGYIQSWNLMLEQELAGGLVGSIGYVGTKTVHSFADWNMDYSTPGTGLSGAPLYQAFGRAATTYAWNGWTDTQYHSMQASLNGRIAEGFVVRSSYTYSKAMNWQDDDGWATISWNDPSMWFRNWARAGYDRTHNFQFGASYEVPFGKGKKYLTEGPASLILGHWQLNGTFAAYSGTPMTVTASGTSLNVRGNTQTADQVKDSVEVFGNIGTAGPWFDPTAYAQVTEVRYGNTHRNSLRGPAAFTNNVSVFRDFPIGERFNLQFKSEFFNLTNSPIFANPTVSYTSSNFGYITSTASNTGSPTERNIRFGLRLSF